MTGVGLTTAGCFFSTAMANPEHLEILKRGAAEWNRWREANPVVWPDLLGAAFPREKLDGVNLENTNLLQANLEGASLAGANLRNANLREADLRRANLKGADFYEANLSKAKLQEADLERANLRHANLLRVEVDRTNLAFATFGYTAFDHRIIEGCLGLDAVYHAEHSIVDVQIFHAAAQFLHRKPPMNRTVRWFLQNAQIPELIAKGSFEMWSQSHEWCSCFVSYSHDDKEFAARLSSSLEARGIPCWRDERGLSLGSVLFEEVRAAIIHHDRTLLCCSRTSLTSSWVNEESNVAFEKERQTGKNVVVPLAIDGSLLEKLNDPDAPPLVHRLQRRLIADFKGWNDPGIFETAMNRLARELKASAGGQDQKTR